MKVTTYENAEAFLNRTQAALEADEAVNSLMLGICLTLKQHPERIKQPPCFRTVEDEDGLVLSVMMTPPHELIVSGHRDDMEDAIVALAKSLKAEGIMLPGSFGPKQPALVFAQHWTEMTGQDYQLVSAQRVWELRKVLLPTPTHGHLRSAVESEIETLAAWWRGFHTDIWGGDGPDGATETVRQRVQDGRMFVWDVDGQPVSMAIKTRPVRHGISVSMVYTPPELRGKGYATACVGELSRLLLESGWAYCSLFTDLANPISNHVYEKIGYRPVCDYDKYTFVS